MDMTGRDNPLVSLGLTEMEARVYMHLLEGFPVTGYGLAKGLGKPAANIYKALESLEKKGAVLVEEGDPRLYRPVSPAHLLKQMDRKYQRFRDRADAALAQIHSEIQDDRVYRLGSTDQVQENARRMLSAAREIVLLDVFPEMFDALAEEIRQTVARGVLVGMKTYAPANVEGAIVVRGRNADEVRERWPGSWLNMVVDGSQYMMALLSKDLGRVIQAIWTECPYLAWVHQSAFSSEIILADLVSRIEAGASLDELQAAQRDLFRLKARMAPGFRLIMRQLGPNEQENGDG